jgi:aromatic ring-opening dioxygenase catalytic subunit (LigB family)
MDDSRGIDHGVFIPFKLIYPDADVPIIPMSLMQNMDVAQHITIGQALAPLRDEDVLIVGSGMSFHNMRAMMTGTHAAESAAFDTWLSDAVAADQPKRNVALSQWANADGSRASHPQEEHLLPLMVAAGAAGADLGRKTFGGTLGNLRLSGFTFG